MIIRLMRFCLCTGQSGVIEMIAEQFGIRDDALVREDRLAR